MIKLITILFLALVYWVLLFTMADAIAQLAIHIDKTARRALKKRRCNNG